MDRRGSRSRHTRRSNARVPSVEYSISCTPLSISSSSLFIAPSLQPDPRGYPPTCGSTSSLSGFLPLSYVNHHISRGCTEVSFFVPRVATLVLCALVSRCVDLSVEVQFGPTGAMRLSPHTMKARCTPAPSPATFIRAQVKMHRCNPVPCYQLTCKFPNIRMIH